MKSKNSSIILLLVSSLALASLAGKVDRVTVEGISLGLSIADCNSLKGICPVRTERVPPANLWAFYTDDLSVKFSMSMNGDWIVSEVWGASLEESDRVVVRRGMSVAQVKQILGSPLSQQEGPKNSMLMIYSGPTRKNAVLVQFFGDNVGFIGISTITEVTD